GPGWGEPSVRVLSGDPRPPAQAPPTHRVTRPGHFSPERGPTAPSPEAAGKWYFPEVTSRPPRAASDTYRKWRTEAGASRHCGGRGDPGAAATMGRAFGNLTRVRHVITYSLSPFEQRAFPHYFTKGIPNVLRRIQASILRSAPPFVAFYLLYTWGTQEFEKSKRKDPAIYENDR
uniref:Cytochrome b-c1 complex subunit 8 n=2 Tax=Rhinolophus ferrumequinum TaxID=59479 RepID=A0A671FVM1_RHIFE